MSTRSEAKAPVGILSVGAVCHLGADVAEIAHRLFEQPELVCDLQVVPNHSSAVPTGAVTATLPDASGWPAQWRSRNNQLLAQAAMPLKAHLDAHPEIDRTQIGILIGTSTSGIGEAEIHLSDDGSSWSDGFHYGQQEMGSPAAFLAWYLGTGGPSWTVSTACSSSAKAIAAAARLLDSKVVRHVIAGGADSLCAFTLNGFASLGATSRSLCDPFAKERDGINIGEGAALFLLGLETSDIVLKGWGESADAFHMSAPDPSAQGAWAAVRQAFNRAGVTAAQIQYFNAHGTGTEHNDAMEVQLISLAGLQNVPMSSTKPRVGHTLGAAGAIEAVLAWIVLAEQRIPVMDMRGAIMSSTIELAHPERPSGPVRNVLSTSFAFGGSNAALILGCAEVV